MKAVVIGGYGHIGTYLVPMLVDGGYEVTAISRGISKPSEDNPAWKKVTKVKLDRTKEAEDVYKRQYLLFLLLVVSYPVLQAFPHVYSILKICIQP